MKTRKFLWALLPVAAVLLMTACGGDDTDDVTPTPTPNPVTPGTENVVKSVPYSVTVNTGNVTRTSVGSDDITLTFDSDDKLYVQKSDGTVYGCLELKSGIGQTSATFAGTVNYTGSTPPDKNTELTATLVGEGNLLNMIGTDGKVKDDAYITVPATPCETMSEAVKNYSWIRGTGTYGEADFTLKQRTAFMMFSVTIQDGTKGDEDSESDVSVPVKITNGTDTYSFYRTTTGSQFDAHISFVLPFEEGKTIAGDASMCVANVGGDDESIRIGTGTDVTLVGGNVYPVTRTKDFVRLWAGGPVWSTRNIGATNVTDYGDYYQWGETEPVAAGEICGWNSTYKFYAGGTTDGDVTFKRYVPTGQTSRWGGEGTTPDGKTSFKDYDYVDDAAYAASNGTWRMPTAAECTSLLSNTTYNNGKRETVSGVVGMKLTGKATAYSKKVLFLPAAGRRDAKNVTFKDQGYCLYWTSELGSDGVAYANSLVLYGDGENTKVTSHSVVRWFGRTIRPVRTN